MLAYMLANRKSGVVPNQTTAKCRGNLPFNFSMEVAIMTVLFKGDEDWGQFQQRQQNLLPYFIHR
jgi:hypothetical protein